MTLLQRPQSRVKRTVFSSLESRRGRSMFSSYGRISQKVLYMGWPLTKNTHTKDDIFHMRKVAHAHVGARNIDQPPESYVHHLYSRDHGLCAILYLALHCPARLLPPKPPLWSLLRPRHRRNDLRRAILYTQQFMFTYFPKISSPFFFGCSVVFH